MKITASKSHCGRFHINADGHRTSLMIEKSNEGGNGIEWVILIDNGDDWPEYLTGGISDKDHAINAISQIAIAVAKIKNDLNSA